MSDEEATADTDFPKDEKKPDSASKWTPKDLITLSFSLVSLILAGSGFYFSNLREDNRLTAQVVDVSMDYQEERSKQPETFTATVALSNPGNKVICLFESWYQVAHGMDLSDGGQGGPCEADKTEMPILIEPKQTRLIRLRIPLIHELAKDGTITSKDERGEYRQIAWALEFLCFDVDGVQHESTSGFRGVLVLNKEEIIRADWNWRDDTPERKLLPSFALVPGKEGSTVGLGR